MQLGSCYILHLAFGENLLNTCFQERLVQSHVRKPVAEPGAESRSAESCPRLQSRGSWFPPCKEPLAFISWALGWQMSSLSSLHAPHFQSPFFLLCVPLFRVLSAFSLSLPPSPSTPLTMACSIRVVAAMESSWPWSREVLKSVEWLCPQLPVQRFLHSSTHQNALQLTPPLQEALQQR